MNDYSKLADSKSPFAQRCADLLIRGFSVIPVQPGSKDTVIGALARTRDMAVIETWADDGHFNSNVGLCADDAFTLLETDNNETFRQKIRELTGQEIPRTLTLGSGRPNRCTRVFKRTALCGDRCPNVDGIFEFRNKNQYVVAPGSVHPLGLTYRWLDDAPIVEIPDWLWKHSTSWMRAARNKSRK